MHKNSEILIDGRHIEKRICTLFIYKRRDQSTFKVIACVDNYYYYYTLIIIKYNNYIVYFKVTNFIKVHFPLQRLFIILIII